MENFIKLPVKKIIINLNNISFISPHYKENGKWNIIFFNHTAMGTNNVIIEEEDYNYLINIVIK